ncbi:hypothetical protein [Deinococcus radiotolerans]|uniref:Uncharacterized protein n=1 Tax=Deinococcus radiotolerans TaxID=1309407 RepID=A0ABQ2FJS9_9DEIO|nr:hypothetical protein [Deinococcus radiotolerans]GGK99803.1 hypothetical protein GCM10010844_17690 [Deinococcus radiotolerans]
MTPAAPTPQRKEQVAVGTRAPRPSTPDLDELTRRVYALMLEDLRLDHQRRGGSS